MDGDFFMTKQKCKPWEIALLLALCLFFLSGIWAGRTQRDLANGLVRLHVIANSDSDADQAEKLLMRDKVLDLLSPLLAGCDSREDAADVILTHKSDLEALGDVSVTLDTEYYPTRNYDTFSLPAGEYLSLRVILGAGQGHNWWCVVFPPLCTEALARQDTDAFRVLDEDQQDLITRNGTGTVLRFRLVEWWQALASLIR